MSSWMQWAPILAAVLSVLAAVGALLRAGTQRGIDKATLDNMKREQRDEQDKRERARREDEDRREQERKNADTERNRLLREELAALSRRSNTRFYQWQEAIADLDDLWSMVEDDMLPWMREAYRKLADAGIDMRRPPQMRRRIHREAIADNGDPDDNVPPAPTRSGAHHRLEEGT